MSSPQQYRRPVYLEEAAALLRRSLEGYERFYSGMAAGGPSLAEKRQEVAEAFIRLAAVERGLVPAEWLRGVVRDAAKEQRT